MAYTETIRPIVEKYKQDILNDMKPKHRRSNEIITDIKYDWTMSEKDFKVYLKRCNKARKEAGLNSDNSDQCPLLVAENLQREAEHKLIDAMYPITNVNISDIFSNEKGLKIYDKFIDLSLRFVKQFI